MTSLLLPRGAIPPWCRCETALVPPPRTPSRSRASTWECSSGTRASLPSSREPSRERSRAGRSSLPAALAGCRVTPSRTPSRKPSTVAFEPSTSVVLDPAPRRVSIASSVSIQSAATSSSAAAAAPPPPSPPPSPGSARDEAGCTGVAAGVRGGEAHVGPGGGSGSSGGISRDELRAEMRRLGEALEAERRRSDELLELLKRAAHEP